MVFGKGKEAVKYKTMKVFDCQDMPRPLCHAFLELWDNKCNDSSVEWTISSDIDPDAFTQQIDDWLIENGAEGPKDEHASGEEVIIKYWW